MSARFFLLIDSGCGGCAELGVDLGTVARLQVVSGSDADRWGLADYWNGSAPTLVRREQGSPDRSWQGWNLRWQMARLIGVRRWREWPVMLQRETSVRKNSGLVITRRDALLGMAAGALAAAVGTQPATASVPAQRPVALASGDVAAVVKRSPSAQAAVASFGKVKAAYRFGYSDLSLTGLVHAGGGGGATLTFVPDDIGSDAATMSLAFTPGSPDVHYLRPNGQALAAHNFRSGAVTAVTQGITSGGNTMQPDSASSKVKCFVNGVGARTSKCDSHCNACGWHILENDPLMVLTTLATDSDCWSCVACAGGSAYHAAKECF